MAAPALMLNRPDLANSIESATKAVARMEAGLRRPRGRLISFQEAKARQAFLAGFVADLELAITKLNRSPSVEEWRAEKVAAADQLIAFIREQRIEKAGEIIDGLDRDIEGMIKSEHAIAKLIGSLRMKLSRAARIAPEVAEVCEKLWGEVRPHAAAYLEAKRDIRWYVMAKLAEIEPTQTESRPEGTPVRMSANDFAAAIAAAHADA